MLNRLPKNPGNLAQLMADLGHPSCAQIAKALGVSVRTVERWRRGKTPRVALLSLWWLSREGHSAWDCEMANRTALALMTNKALWDERRKQSRDRDHQPVFRTIRPANAERWTA